MGSFFEAVPIVNGFTNLFGQEMTNQANIQAVRETNLANRQLAEYQADWNEKMWEKQNEYNSPSSQMARYQEAGLNPHLMYSQGNPGNATSMPTYSAPTMQTPQRRALEFNFDQAVNELYQIKQIKLKNEAQETENEILRHQATIAYEKSKQEVTNTVLRNYLLKKTDAESFYYDDIARYAASEAESSAGYWFNKRVGQDLLNHYTANKDEREWQKLINENVMTDMAVHKTQQAWAKLDLDAKRIILQASLNRLKPMLDANQLERVDQLIDRLMIENDILGVQRDFEQSFGTANSNLAMKILKYLLYLAK